MKTIQSSIEWLKNEIDNELKVIDNLYGKEIMGRKIGLAFVKRILVQAKEMHKQEIDLLRQAFQLGQQWVTDMQNGDEPTNFNSWVQSLTFQPSKVSAEEVLKQQQNAVSEYVKLKHTQEECIGFIDGYEKAVQNMHSFASEEKKQHAIGFARYYISNKSIVEFNKDNDEAVYNEYLTTLNNK